MLPRKAACRAALVTVPQTDSGGRGEYPKARERTLAKELGKIDTVTSGEGVPVSVKDFASGASVGCRETGVATVY